MDNRRSNKRILQKHGLYTLKRGMIMKKLIKNLIIITLGLSLLSCAKQINDLLLNSSDKSNVKFTISNIVSNVTTKSYKTTSTTKLTHVICTIKNSSNNETIKEKLKLGLYKVGTGYTSDLVQLNNGTYYLSSFDVYSDTDKVYTAVNKEDPLAYLVQKPLPLFFVVSSDVVVAIPEVIKVGENSFSPLKFKIGVKTDINGTLCYINANLKINTKLGTIYEETIANQETQIAIRDDLATYNIIISKEGFKNDEQILTKEQLSNATLNIVLVSGTSNTTTTENETSVNEIIAWSALDYNYNVGDKVGYKNKIYICLAAHKSNAWWAPDISPSLWKEDTGQTIPSSGQNYQDDTKVATPPPAPVVYGVENGVTYATSVVITYVAQTGINITAQINGEAYSFGTVYNQKGAKTLIVTATDPKTQAKSTTTIYFRIGEPAAYNANATKVVAYFTAWGIYARNYQVTNIPAAKLTHINYAFANIQNGEVVLGDSYADTEKSFAGDKWDDPLKGNFNQLIKLKANNPHLKTLISIGGWTWSKYFSDVALTDASREKFAKSAVSFMFKYGFDGIDIDWEYPVGGGLGSNIYRPSDKTNYTLLLKELRKQEDELTKTTGQHYFLTIAAPAGFGTVANLELREIHQYLDWINIMSYDFHGTWETKTNFNAPLYMCSNDPNTDQVAKQKLNVSTAIQLFLDEGVPANKLVMGLPFYGRSYSGADAGSTNGLFQSFTQAGPGSWENGVLDYKDIKQNYLTNPKYTRYWNDEAKVPFLYNSQDKVFISYDDPESIGIKAEYAKSNGLGGVMFWDLTSDTSDSALLVAARNKLGL